MSGCFSTHSAYNRGKTAISSEINRKKVKHNETDYSFSYNNNIVYDITLLWRIK